MSKPKLAQVIDPTEIDEIRKDPGDLSKPFYHFNQATGQLWADADELRAWREKRASGNQSEVK